MNENDRPPLPAEEDDRDRRLAEVLGQYVDRVAEGDNDFRRILLENPDVDPGLAEELETFVKLGSHLEEPISERIDYGEFRKICRLGEGGMGVVYEARQLSLGRRVALKVLSPKLRKRSEGVARFFREARVNGTLNHPNIVQVISMGEEENEPYFAMELVDGETLMGILHRSGAKRRTGTNGRKDNDVSQEVRQALARILTGALVPSSASTAGSGETTQPVGESTQTEGASTQPAGASTQPEGALCGIAGGTSPDVPALPDLYKVCSLRIAEAFAGVADGLQYAHSRGVIHRDITPSNLILDRDARLRILDFGLAILKGEERLSRTGQRPGTLPYMSPEQLAGSRGDLTHRTDIYSIGVTLYEVVSGSLPFRGDSDREIEDRILNLDAPPLRRVNPYVPRDLEVIVHKCLRKDPRRRYGTCEALAQELRRFARGLPIETEPETAFERLRRRVWRSRRKLAEAGGLILLFLTVALIGWQQIAAHQATKLSTHASHVRGAVMEMLRRPLLSAAIRQRFQAGEDAPFAQIQNPVQQQLEPNPFDGGEFELFESGTQTIETSTALSEVGPDPLREAVRTLERCVDDFPEEPAARYHLARGFVSLGEEGRAIEQVSSLLRCHPGFVPALALRASLLAKKGGEEAKAARRALELAAADSPELWIGDWMEAHGAITAKNWDAAGGACERLLRHPAARSSGWDEPYLGSTIEVRLEAGMARLQGGDLIGALEDIAAGTVHAREGMEARLLLGRVRYLMGDEDQAEQKFQALFAGQPGNQGGEVALAVAEVYREFGELQAARRWLERAPRSAEALCARAEVFRRVKLPEEARRFAEEAVTLDGRASRPHIALGNVLMALNLPQEARREYERAVALDPGNASWSVALGVCLDVEGQSDQAIRILRDATAINPGLAHAHYNLGRVLSRAGRREEARRAYEATLGVDPAYALALNNLGVLVDLEGDLDSALERYRQATESAPRLSQARFNRAWVCQRQWRLDEAIREYRKAIELGLQSTTVHKNLAACLQYGGRSQEALQEYDQAIKLHPNDPLAQHGRGVALEYLKQLAESVAPYAEAARLFPAWTTAHNDLGKILRDLGRNDEAARELRKAVECDPANVWAWGNLANLLLKEGGELPRGEELSRDLTSLEDARLLPNCSPAVDDLIEKLREAAGARLLTFASIDAFFDAPRALFQTGGDAGGAGSWHAFSGLSAPSGSVAWTALDYHDEGWSDATLSAFPAASDGSSLKPTTNHTVLYARKRFFVEDTARLGRLWLSLRCSDGFVAYLNGSEAARFRARACGAQPEPGKLADGKEWSPWIRRRFPIESSFLQKGDNVLAIAFLGASRAPLVHTFPVMEAEIVDGRPDPPAVRGARDAFQETNEAPGNRARRAYLEGRLLLAGGKGDEAERLFRESASLAPDRPEPVLRLHEALRAQANRTEAERCLREAIASGGRMQGRLLDVWIRFIFSEMGWSPSKALEALPPKPPRPSLLDQPALDLRWLLGELAGANRVRINCGGTALRTADGNLWGRDRFFQGGLRNYLSRLAGVDPAQTPPVVYQTERTFFISTAYQPEANRIPAYSIPLPPADYRVTLHFVEGVRVTDRRTFGVVLEGVTVLPSFDPASDGFGKTQERSFTVKVTDGALGVDFSIGELWPQVCALEIERLNP